MVTQEERQAIAREFGNTYGIDRLLEEYRRERSLIWYFDDGSALWRKQILRALDFRRAYWNARKSAGL